MVNYNSSLNAVFAALSDPTRRAMLARLSEGSMTVKHLAEPFNISKPAISKHLKVLERAGLLSREIQGREHICRMEAHTLSEAASWIADYQKFWNEKLDALESWLHSSPEEDK